jgi:hypothetical protein
MEPTAIYRRPKKWIAAGLGLFIQPAGMFSSNTCTVAKYESVM